MKPNEKPTHHPPPTGQGNMITLNHLVRKQKGGAKAPVIPNKPAATTQRGAVVLCKKILCKWTGTFGIRSPLISIVKLKCGCGKSKEAISVSFRNSDDKVWKAVVSVCKECGKPRAAKIKKKPRKKKPRSTGYYDINRYYEWDM